MANAVRRLNPEVLSEDDERARSTNHALNVRISATTELQRAWDCPDCHLHVAHAAGTGPTQANAGRPEVPDAGTDPRGSTDTCDDTLLGDGRGGVAGDYAGSFPPAGSAPRADMAAQNKPMIRRNAKNTSAAITTRLINRPTAASAPGRSVGSIGSAGRSVSSAFPSSSTATPMRSSARTLRADRPVIAPPGGVPFTIPLKLARDALKNLDVAPLPPGLVAPTHPVAASAAARNSRPGSAPGSPRST